MKLSLAKVSRTLNFGVACFGVSASAYPCSANFNTYFSEKSSPMRVFLLVDLGTSVPVISMQLLGAAMYTDTHVNPNWNQAYETESIGGLLGAILPPLDGFGKFLLVIFALSAVACNIITMHSLSAQVVAPQFKRVAHFLYTVIGTTIYTLLAIGAASNFSDVLTAFMSIVWY